MHIDKNGLSYSPFDDHGLADGPWPLSARYPADDAIYPASDPLDVLPRPRPTIFTVEGTGHPDSWRLEMHGNTITGLVIDGRPIIESPRADITARQAASRVRKLIDQMTEVLNQEGILW